MSGLPITPACFICLRSSSESMERCARGEVLPIRKAERGGWDRSCGRRGTCARRRHGVHRGRHACRDASAGITDACREFQSGEDGQARCTTALAAWRQNGENLLQALANMLEIGRRVDGEGEGDLLLLALAFIAQVLARARDGVSLFIEQALDANDAFNVPTAIHALAGIALDGFQLRELSFPEAQDVGREPAETGDFPDAEVQLFRDHDFARLARFSVALFLGTHAACERWRPSAGRPEFPP